jgi:hypothetical protein
MDRTLRHWPPAAHRVRVAVQARNANLNGDNSGPFGTTGLSHPLGSQQAYNEASAGAERIAGGGSMAIEKLAAHPTTKRQEDIAALKLFCLLAFIFVVL